MEGIQVYQLEYLTDHCTIGEVNMKLYQSESYYISHCS